MIFGFLINHNGGKLKIPCTAFALSFFLSSIANAELQIVTVEEPPTNYELNGKITGTTVDIVERIINDLNLNTKIQLLPTARAIDMLMKEPGIIFFTAAYTPERVQHGLQYIAPVITTRLAFYKKKGSAVKVKDLDDVKKQ